MSSNNVLQCRTKRMCEGCYGEMGVVKVQDKSADPNSKELDESGRVFLTQGMTGASLVPMTGSMAGSKEKNKPRGWCLFLGHVLLRHQRLSLSYEKLQICNCSGMRIFVYR